MKLIVEPNFFSKILLNIGQYDALESSGLQTQPFLSYKSCCPKTVSGLCISIQSSLTTLFYTANLWEVGIGHPDEL